MRALQRQAAGAKLGGNLSSTVPLPAPPNETPRGAYSLLERRATLTVVGCLLALAAVAWFLTARQAADMGQLGGLALTATAMSMSLSARYSWPCG